MPEVLQNPATMPSHASGGARLVSLTGKTLPLRSVTLTSEAAGGIARTRLRQHFANPHHQPLELAYSFPLPADGTVAAYQMRAGDRTIEGRVEKRDEARASFEAARLQGRTAALLDQERPNLFTQQLGNIPALTDVIIELTVDHLLAWRPGAWEWRFPTVVAPRYLGAAGVVADHERVTVDLADRPTGLSASVTLRIADDLDIAPTSPTHCVLVENGILTLAEDTPLDRDIVIRWNARRQSPGCTVRAMQPATAGSGPGESAYGLLTIVPPAGHSETFARDLILLLDVSGSMSGKPLEQMKRVVISLVESLGDEDQLEMIAFSSDAARYRSGPVQATARERRKACNWVEALTAGGGTEMIGAIEEALRPVRSGVPRQVVVVTDGLIGFESSAVRAIRDGLPRESRLHAVGVGSAPNRAFLRPAAKAGRGVEVLIDLGEAAAQGAEQIVAATRAPVLVDVTIEGTALQDGKPRLADLLEGSPLVSALRLKPSGGTLVVRARTPQGIWEDRVDVRPAAASADDGGTIRSAIPALWARQTIEDLELDLACGGARADIDRQIETIALRHSVSSRLTSWIAIAHEPSVDPRDPVRLERIPQTLPYGMSPDTFAQGVVGSLSIADPAAFGPFLMRSAHLKLDDAPTMMPASTEAAAFGDALEEMSLQRQVALRGRGRIVPTPGRATTTLEVRLLSDLDWPPNITVRVHGHAIGVVESGTTRPGPVAAGMLVRIELEAAPDDIKDLGPFEILCGDRVLLVTIDPD